MNALKILVCVKQVPDTENMKVDPATNTLIRTGPAMTNPYDEYALELALGLKEKHGGSVALLSMGPQGAEEALRDCLALGGDEAYLLCDRRFAGADTLATSYTLSAAIRHIEGESGAPFDLIFCGKQSVDGETGQVGPELAEALGLPQITLASQLRVTGQAVQALRELDDCQEWVEAPLPALVCVAKSDLELSFPSILSKLAAMDAPVSVYSADDFPFDEAKIGLAGSPTLVSDSFAPDFTRKRQRIQEGSIPASVRKLKELLRSDGAL